MLVYKFMAQKVVAQTKALIAAKLHTFSRNALKWLLLRPVCSLAITFFQRASTTKMRSYPLIGNAF